MGFTVFRSCMTVLICLFLLMLFLVPSAYLDRFCAEADARIEAAESALLSGDLPAAAPHCAALFSLVRERMPVLERFLNHASIDALDAAVAVVSTTGGLEANTEKMMHASTMIAPSRQTPA